MFLGKDAPVRPIARPAPVIEVHHRHVQIQNPLAHPAAPVLQHIHPRRGRGKPLGIRRDTRRETDRVRRNFHLRLQGNGIQIHFPHQPAYLIAAELQPLRIRRGRRAAHVVTPAETIQRVGVITPRPPRVAHVVEVEPVHVVARDDVHRYVEDVPLHRRQRSVELIIPAVPVCVRVVHAQPLRMHQVGMIRRRGRRAQVVPDEIRGDPRVNLDAPPAGMRLGQQIGQRVKTLRRHVRGLRFNRAVVIGVTPPAHFHDNGVEVVCARRVDQRRDLAAVSHSGVKRVRPQRAKLRLLRRRRGDERRKEHGAQAPAHFS